MKKVARDWVQVEVRDVTRILADFNRCHELFIFLFISGGRPCFGWLYSVAWPPDLQGAARTTR